jgi:hypothetical protein
MRAFVILASGEAAQRESSELQRSLLRLRIHQTNAARGVTTWRNNPTQQSHPLCEAKVPLV